MQIKFLIYISYSYALPIGNPLEQEINSRGYEVHWFSDLEDGKKSIADKKNRIDTIEELVDYRPDVVLTATDMVPDFITGIKVQIFHGFLAQKRPEKKNGFAHFRIRGFFDLYCTQGPSTTEPFLKKQKEKKFFEVVETGWSKVDPLFPLNDYALRPKCRVLIASTFTKRLSLAYDHEIFEKINLMSKKGLYNFIMVLHPKLPQEIRDKWKSINGPNFKYINTTELIPIFKETDILLADTTSVVQEYLLQIKPVVCYKHTHRHDYLINVEQPCQLQEAMDMALEYPRDLLKKIETYVNNLHPYKDGKSSMRVVDACVEFLFKDKSHLSSKPLNLIRKYKIRKRLNYFTLASHSRAYTK